MTGDRRYDNAAKVLIRILSWREKSWNQRLLRFNNRCETIHIEESRAESNADEYSRLKRLSLRWRLRLHARSLRKLNAYNRNRWEYAVVLLFAPFFLTIDLISMMRSHKVDTLVFFIGSLVALQSWVWANSGGVRNLYWIWSNALICVFYFAILLRESPSPNEGLIRTRNVANATLIFGLFIVLAMWWAIWAQADWRVSATTQGCFSVRLTHTDSVFYAITNFTTLGAGTIHPISQSCERLMSLQSASNWIVIVVFISIALSRLFLGRQLTKPIVASDDVTPSEN